jgi:hypothetical protein
MSVKKPQSTDDNIESAPGKFFFVNEVYLIGANFLGTQQSRRLAKIFCELGNRVDVFSLGSRSEVSHPHVLGHTLTQGCHKGLLSKVNVASIPTSCLRKEPFVSVVGNY